MVRLRTTVIANIESKKLLKRAPRGERVNVRLIGVPKTTERKDTIARTP